MSHTEQQIVKFLEPFNGEIGSLAQQLREYLRKETKPTFDLGYGNQQTLSYRAHWAGKVQFESPKSLIFLYK